MASAAMVGQLNLPSTAIPIPIAIPTPTSTVAAATCKVPTDKHDQHSGIRGASAKDLGPLRVADQRDAARERARVECDQAEFRLVVAHAVQVVDGAEEESGGQEDVEDGDEDRDSGGVDLGDVRGGVTAGCDRGGVLCRKSRRACFWRKVVSGPVRVGGRGRGERCACRRACCWGLGGRACGCRARDCVSGC